MIKDLSVCHREFAWFPIIIKNQEVWLSLYYVRRIDGTYWDYYETSLEEP